MNNKRRTQPFDADSLVYTQNDLLFRNISGTIKFANALLFERVKFLYCVLSSNSSGHTLTSMRLVK